MARIPLALAAVTLAATLGSNLAQAQSSPAYQTPATIAPTGEPIPQQAAPGMAPAGRMHHGRPMRPHRPMPGQAGMTPPPAPMAGTGMAATTMTPSGPMVQTPNQPFNGLSLPQQGVGDGAYNGGGVVLEYLPDGTRRVVQQ